MSDTTTYLGWTIPTKWDDDWYLEFVSLMNEVDAAVAGVAGEGASVMASKFYINSDGLSSEDSYLFFSGIAGGFLRYDYNAGSPRFHLNKGLWSYGNVQGTALFASKYLVTRYSYAASTYDCQIYFGDPSKYYETLHWDAASARFEFSGPLYVGGNLAGHNLYVGVSSPTSTASAYIYFGSDGAEYLKWNSLQNRFEFSNDLYVDGPVRSTGHLQANGNVYVQASTKASAASAYIAIGSDAGEYIRWNPLQTRFEFSDNLYVAGDLTATGSVVFEGGTLLIGPDASTVNAAYYPVWYNNDNLTFPSAGGTLLNFQCQIKSAVTTATFRGMNLAPSIHEDSSGWRDVAGIGMGPTVYQAAASGVVDKLWGISMAPAISHSGGVGASANEMGGLKVTPVNYLGNVTNLYNIRTVALNTYEAGSCTNHYGLYIEDIGNQVKGSAYAIYTNAGSVYFGDALLLKDNLYVGVTSPTSTASAYIYFGSDGAEHIRWNPLQTRFEVSDDVYLAGGLDVTDDHINVASSQTPSGSSYPGTQGDIAWDATHVYVCISTNTWGRAELDFAFP